MTATATVTATATATVTDADTIAATETELWPRIEYLVLLAPKLMWLKAQLDSDDPTFAQSAFRPDAEARYELMKTRRVSCMTRIAALWEALPEDRQGVFLEQYDWLPYVITGVDFANMMWDVAKRPDAGALGKAPW